MKAAYADPPYLGCGQKHYGDRPGTLDIVRHPNEMMGDRWRNVPLHDLRPVPANV